MAEPHDIVVFGPGAMGLVLARYLAKAGNSVGLFGKKRWAETIGENGIEFIRPDPKTGEILERDKYYPNEKDFKFYSEETIGELESRGLKPEGLILLASKTPNLEDVVLSAQKIIRSENRPYILMIQNGINPEVRIQQLLQNRYNGISDRLIGGVVMAMISITDFVNPTVKYGLADITLGSWERFDDRADSAFVIGSMLGRPLKGIATVTVSENETSYRYKRFEKAALNGANALSAIFNVKVGEILDNPLLNLTMKEKLMEAARVVNAEGMEMDETDLLKSAHNVYDVKVRGHYASMAQDLQIALKTPGRLLVTEIRDLDLAFSERGDSHKIQTPFNRFYGGLIEDFTMAYNILKALDAKEGNKVAEEFTLEFLAGNNELVKLKFPRKINTGTLTERLYERLQELKAKYLKGHNIPIDYNYRLENVVKRPELYILVVDDEKRNADLQAKNLRLNLRDNDVSGSYNLQIMTAYSGEEAIKLAQGKNVAVVLADVVMPVMKGYQMRVHFSPNTPFVFYSGRATSEDRGIIRRQESELLSKVYEDPEEMTDAVVVGIEKYENSITKHTMF